MKTIVEMRKDRWVKSNNGIVSGVLDGIAKNFGMDPNVLRLLWLITVFVFGTGILLYLILALVLPREDEIDQYYQKKVLGVCHYIARKNQMELGLVRLFCVGCFIASAGTAVIGYVALYFIFKCEGEKLGS